MRVEYHPEAQRDLIDAAEWYEGQREGLGSDFLDAVDAAVVTIVEAPDRWVILRDGIRRYHMRRFPYAIQYRVDADRILILTIKHHRKHPDYGSGRR